MTVSTRPPAISALLCPVRAENEPKTDFISLSVFQSSEGAVGVQTLLCVACPRETQEGSAKLRMPLKGVCSPGKHTHLVPSESEAWAMQSPDVKRIPHL